MPSTIVIPEQTDRVAEYFATVKERCVPLARQYTVSIVGYYNEKILHDRTGVLYQIGDHYFVLTASHDLHGLATSDIPLFFFDTEIEGGFIQITTATMMGTETDILDVAVIEIDKETAMKLSKYKSFLRHHQVVQGGARPGVPYLFYGFPKAWALRSVNPDIIHSKGLAFATYLHDDELESDTNYDPRFHMTLGFSRDALNIDSRVQEHLPELQGISGCGIWRIRKSVNKQRGNDNDIALVGIENCYSEKCHYVMATRVEYALKLINDNYPDTVRMMNVAYSVS